MSKKQPILFVQPPMFPKEQLLSEWNWTASNVPIVTVMGGFGD